MKLELLTVAMARLGVEMATEKGRPFLFTSKITDTTEYLTIFDAIDKVAKDNNMYIGERTYILDPLTKMAEIRVGVATDAKTYHSVYGG